jgi:hypothetical protein
VLPGGGGLGVQPQGADARVVGLKVLPEHLAQSEGQGPQARVVQLRLTFPQVGDEQVTDRPAGQIVAVDQFPDRDLPLGGEDAHRAGGGSGKHAEGMQHLVEVQARVAPPAGTEDSREVKAVPDRDVGDHAAPGGQQGRDPAQGSFLGVSAGRVPRRQLFQPGEARRIAAAGHLGHQVLDAAGGQQPGQARPQDIGAQQRQQAPAELDGLVPGRDAGPLRSAQVPRGQLPPLHVAGLLGSAGQPLLLPRGAGLACQPVEHLDQASLTSLLVSAAGHGERRRQEPSENDLAVLAGGGPGRPIRGPGREPFQQRRQLRSDRDQRTGPGRSGGRPAAHAVPSPNKVFSDSAR